MRRVPSIPPAALVGRDAELARLEHALERVTLVLVLGVPGVGKSALLGALAARSRRSVVYHVVRAGETVGDVVDAIRRGLARGRIRQSSSDEDRLVDLVDRLERIEALLVIDDLHQLGEQGQALLASLGGALETARVAAASRERPLETARDPLRFELRLDSLDLEQARELWELLDGLYGPAKGFELAWERTHGNPLLLRRAHAGDLDVEDPIRAAADKLSDDECFVAGALALAQMPLERSLVEALLPDGRATRALRGLAARLLVVVDGTGAASLHELFRAPLLERSEPEQKRTIHATLARTMSEANLDPVSRVREVCRHLRGAGEYDALVRYVRDHARELVRQGAASELTRLLDAVPEPHRTVELETLRARALARSVDLHRAFTVLESLVQRAGAGDPEVMLTYARVATLMGRIELAEQTLLPLLEQPLSHEHRVRAMIAYALLATHSGRGDEARARLTAFEQETNDPLGRAVLAGYLAFTYWLDERDHEAASLVPQAQALAQEVLARADSFRAAVGLPYGLAAVLGRLGRIDEAERLLAAARAASAIDEDVLMRLELRLVEGDVLFQKGERLAALSELEAVSSDAQGGYLLADLWARVFRARVLRSLGRRRAAERLDLETERIAGEAGVVAVERAVGRSRARATLAPEPGDTQLEPEPKLGEWIRRLALEALERAARGDAERLEAVERASSAFIAAPGYGLDRALLALARAALAETLGRHAEAKSHQRRAFAEAEAEKIDADLLVALAPAVGSLRVVSSTSRRIASRVDTTGWELVLDAREHTLKAGERTLSLKNRHVVRCILYALAREPEHHLNKERLAEAAWGVAYDPRVHDGALKVNLLRLRTLLRDTGLAVDYEMDGYRLRGTAQLLFVEPLTVPD